VLHRTGDCRDRGAYQDRGRKSFVYESGMGADFKEAGGNGMNALSRKDMIAELILIRDLFQKSLDKIPKDPEKRDEYDPQVERDFERKIEALNNAILFLNML
jgi:hypothetical protein